FPTRRSSDLSQLSLREKNRNLPRQSLWQFAKRHFGSFRLFLYQIPQTENPASWLQPLLGITRYQDRLPAVYSGICHPVSHGRSRPAIPGLSRTGLTIPVVNPLFFLQ